jgi:hypothetical protein
MLRRRGDEGCVEEEEEEEEEGLFVFWAEVSGDIEISIWIA